MTFLYPDLLMSDGVENCFNLAEGNNEKIFQETLADREAKFLDIVKRVINIGYAEEGLIKFLTEAKLKELGGLSLIEHFTQDESIEAYEKALRALEPLEQ